MKNLQANESQASNKINEYLSRKHDKGTFNVDEILASRAVAQKRSPKVDLIDPFKRMKPNPNNLLKSYKEARAEKQANMNKDLSNKIQGCDNDMIEKLSNLMNIFEIGDSTPLEGDLQRINEVEEPERITHIEKQHYDIQDESEFDHSIETNNAKVDQNNPFTKQSNFLAYHTIENDGKGLLPGEDDQEYSNTNIKEIGRYKLPDDNEPSNSDDNIDFPRSYKHNERYSKC